MANETRGILFETIADIALKEAVKLAGIAGTLRWNEKPENMSIVPDFTIGLTKNEPSHVVLVTAIGAARNADMKSWRSLGEMQEVKAQLPTVPTVLNLFFKSEVKQGLALLGIALYDSTLHVDQKLYYEPLETWVQENLESDAKTREARQEMLAGSMKSDLALAGSITALAQDIAQALQQRKTELDSLWALMRVDFAKPHTLPQAKNTTVRRGLGKLLVLEPHLRQLLYASYDKPNGIQLNAIPQYAWDLGFFKKSMVGAKVTDQEIEGALNLLGAITCETVLQKAPNAIKTWTEPLRNLGNIIVFSNFVKDNYSFLTTPSGMLVFLQTQYVDPYHGLNKNLIAGNLQTAWIFDFISSLDKAKSKRTQSFGFAYLSQHRLSKREKIGNMDIGTWCSCFMNQFFNRLPNFNPPIAAICYVSEVLSEKLREFSPKTIEDLTNYLKNVYINTNLEKKLIPYRNFEPLLWLLEAELKKQGKSYSPKVPYVGWINEYAGVGKNSATTPFIKVGNTLIHWKSVSDAGKGHKKKELAARARSIKYEYHSSNRTFARRQGVDQLALIVDGTFNDNDLKILASAGWDIIVYPDKIEELVSSL